MIDITFLGEPFSPLKQLLTGYTKCRFRFFSSVQLENFIGIAPSYSSIVIVSRQTFESLGNDKTEAVLSFVQQCPFVILLTDGKLSLAQKAYYEQLGFTLLSMHKHYVEQLSEVMASIDKYYPSYIQSCELPIEENQLLDGAWQRDKYFKSLEQLMEQSDTVTQDCILLSSSETEASIDQFQKTVGLEAGSGFTPLLVVHHDSGFTVLNSPSEMLRDKKIPLTDLIIYVQTFLCYRCLLRLQQHEKQVERNRGREIQSALDAHAIVSAADRSGRIVYVNDAFCEISGFDRKELIGNSHNLVKSGVHDDQFYQQMWAAISSGQKWSGEICNRNKDGSLYWVEATIVPFLDEQGEIYEYFSIRTDITVHKLREAEIRQHDQLLRASHEVANIGTWQWNIQTGDLYWSERIAPLFGYAPGALDTSYENFIAAVHPDDREKLTQAVEKSVADGSPYEIEHRVLWPDGSEKWVLEKGAVDFDELGQPVSMVGVVFDIDARKVAELELAKSQHRFTFAVEGAGDGVWDWNIETGGLVTSELYKEMLGYRGDELPESIEHWISCIHPDDLERYQKLTQAYLGGELSTFSMELRVRCKNGEYRWILRRGTIVECDLQGNPVRMIGIHSDISERKEVETNLKLFREVFNASDQCMAVADSHGKIIFINDAYSQTMGYSFDEVLGHDVRKFIDSGDEIAGSIADTLLDKRKNWNGLTTRRRKDGSTFIAANSFGTVKDNDGNILYVFVIFYDFSQEQARRDELSQAKESAEQASRAKSEFLSRMSHELRTPMNAVIGFAQLLEYDEDINPDQLDNIHEIIKAGNHLLELINEVLDLAKIESGHIEVSMEPVDLEYLLSECEQLVGPLLKEYGVSCSIGPINQSVIADRVRLKQVFINLLSNAIKYNRSGGWVNISASAVGNGQLKISFEDSGIGISAEAISDLFEPFSRLGLDDTSIEGTGIGLTITQRLVELMGGEISVYSEYGSGSTFNVILRLGESEEFVVKEQGRLLQPEHGDGNYTVLCVDDNPTNLKLLAQVLRTRSDLNLQLASTPEEGLELAMAPIPPDLIMLDINMPRISGYDVVEIIKKRDSLKETPIIAVTANAMKSDIQKGRAAGFDEYLTKPIDIGQTLSVVRKYLPVSREGRDE